jgi:uncharacterized BrkB/YihY/UPF0761 family membrane protein
LSSRAESRLSTKQQVESIWDLGGWTVPQLAKQVCSEIDHDDLLSLSSALAYNFLLAIFPMLLFLIALLGIFAAQRSNLQNSLFYYFSKVLSPAAFQLVSKTLTEIVKNSGGGKLTFGFVLALWSGAGGMSSLMSGLNTAYHVRESRSWIKVRLIAIGLTLATSVLVVAALFVVLLGSHLAELIGAHFALGTVAVVTWKVLEWPDRHRFSHCCLRSGLLLRSRSQRTALVLDHAGFGDRRHSLGAGVGWLTHLLALLQ